MGTDFWCVECGSNKFDSTIGDSPGVYQRRCNGGGGMKFANVKPRNPKELKAAFMEGFRTAERVYRIPMTERVAHDVNKLLEWGE